MKKIFFMTILFVASATGFAQNVDNFNVGPYEVDYRGMGDYKIRMREGIDLYKFYNLKRDTVIQKATTIVSNPVSHAIQLSLFFENATYRAARYSNLIGVEGVWKQQISDGLMLNGGVSLGLASCTCNIIKEGMFEVGIPISLELGKLNRNTASLYGSIGIIPTFYSNSTAEYDSETIKGDLEKYNGFYIAPKIEAGGYIPVDDNFIRFGVYFKHKINCSTKDYDIYKNVIGKTFFGVNVGFVF